MHGNEFHNVYVPKAWERRCIMANYLGCSPLKGYFWHTAGSLKQPAVLNVIAECSGYQTGTIFALGSAGAPRTYGAAVYAKF